MQFEELKTEQLEACKALKPSPEAPSYFDLLRALGNLLDGFSAESIHFRGAPNMRSVDVDHLRAVKIATMNTAAQTFPKHPLCRAYFDGQAVQGKYKGKKFSGRLDLSNSKALPDRENMIFCVKLDSSNSKSKTNTKKARSTSTPATTRITLSRLAQPIPHSIKKKNPLRPHGQQQGLQ